jgi:Porin subfamily
MSLIKGSLLSTAAVLVSLGTAHAADLPVKAAPAQYMKVCNLYGDGFYYIPGTDTCLKLGGYLRIQNEYNMGAGGGAIGNGSTEAAQARFARDVTNDMNYRVRAAMTWDVRQQTDYGTLRTYIRWGAENTTPLQTGGGTTFSPFWDRVFLQFAGFTVGKAVSFFDLFTYAALYSYHDPRITGDTTTSNGVPLWAYTAQFGAGVSASLSLEDPAAKATQVVDATLPGFFAVRMPGPS